MKPIRRSLELNEDQWQSLKQIAVDMGSIAPSGPTVGQPSWRTLIKDIADGSLTVSRKEQTDEPA